MLGSFVQENALISGIAGTILLALVVLLAGAVISHLLDRRRRPAAERHEPPFDHHPDAGWGGAEPAAMPAAPPIRPERTGFGFTAVAVAFLLGLVAGGAGIAVSSGSVASAVGSLMALVESGSETSSHTAAVSPTPPATTDMAAAGAAMPADVSAKLAAFAESLQASLPRAAGPELSLTRVDLDGMRLSLGYAVGRVMAENETRAFDAYILRTVKSLFCGRESREIRFLSENGVVFDMEYTDPKGRTVSKLTVAPGFCA